LQIDTVCSLLSAKPELSPTGGNLKVLEEDR
jgi:hypothetical protein